MVIKIMFTSALLTMSTMVHAGELAGRQQPPPPPHSTTTKAQISDTPACLNIDLKKGEKVTQGTLPANTPDLELVTRLVYAESIAAHCPDDRDNLPIGITSVIFNRIHAFEANPATKADAVKRTVFGKDQFASSLHSYAFSGGVGAWKDFVCPKDLNFYRRVRGMVLGVNGGEINVSAYSKATHYYLHKHGDKYKDQPWGSKARLVQKLGGNCLGLYEVDKGFLNAKPE